MSNTTIAACYVPIYVITNAHWYGKLQEEIDSVIATHRKDSSQTSADILATLTLVDWENKFPVLQLCLHETLRFTVLNPVYRKNITGRDLPIGKTGEVIPRDSYVVSSFILALFTYSQWEKKLPADGEIPTRGLGLDAG